MAIHFDFLAPPVYASASAISPTGTYLGTFVISDTLSSNSPSGPIFHMNASGDLEVDWGNGNASGSGLTEDVSVRLTIRWVGA